MVMIPNGPGKPNNYVEFIDDLKQLVAEGKVSQERIDDAVRRILRIKLQTRLFDHPFTDTALTDQIGSAEHRAVARQCVQASLVLLKNENHALPLSKQIKHLHVVGRGGRRHWACNAAVGRSIGRASRAWSHMAAQRFCKAIRDAVDAGGQVTYAAGSTTDDDQKKRRRPMRSSLS